MGRKKNTNNTNGKGSGGPLSADVMTTLKSRSCSKEVMRKGVIFCQLFLTDPTVVSQLESQLKENGIEYEISNAPDGNGVVINITGAMNKQGEMVRGDVSKMKTNDSGRLPDTGQWKTDDGLPAEKGNGRWFPDPQAEPQGFPQEPSEKDKKSASQMAKKREKGKKEAKIERVDQIIPMYDENTGDIIRYPWGNPGDSKKDPVPETLTAQVEALVNGHRKRHGIEEEYTFNGVLYENGKPKMEEFSMGTVKTDFYTTDRDVNFKIGDELMANQLNQKYRDSHGGADPVPPYTIKSVRKYRENNDLTWHEDPDCQTMMKVPSILHANSAHSGGVSEEKNIGCQVFGDKQNKNLVANAGSAAEDTRRTNGKTL